MLEDIRAEVLAPDRLNAVVFGGFAALALAISVVGVAGILAFSVNWRVREFAIRLALGAPPLQILASVLKDGITIAAIGVPAGAFVGLGLSRLANITRQAVTKHLHVVEGAGLVRSTLHGRESVW